MQQHFLIFSLPRSRSTWLSVTFTTDRSLCLHDHTAYSPTLPETQHEFVGMACTGAVMKWQHWTKLYPDAAVMTVRRDPYSAALSFSRVLEVTPESLIDSMCVFDAKLDELERETGCLSVKFSDLSERIEEAWRHCLPGIPIDLRRLAQLKKFNIQPNPSMMRAEIDAFLKARASHV